MGDRETPLNREIQSKIDEIDFLLRLGDSQTVIEEVSPLFRETVLSFVTVKVTREKVEKQVEILETLERESGMSLKLAFSIFRGKIGTEDPDQRKIARTLVQIAEEIQDMYEDINRNLKIFGTNYETYRRISSHLYHVGLGPNHEKNRSISAAAAGEKRDDWWKDIRLDRIQFPADVEVQHRFVTTAKIVLYNVGWNIEGSLFRGQQDINLEFLLKRRE